MAWRWQSWRIANGLRSLAEVAHRAQSLDCRDRIGEKLRPVLREVFIRKDADLLCTEMADLQPTTLQLSLDGISRTRMRDRDHAADDAGAQLRFILR